MFYRCMHIDRAKLNFICFMLCAVMAATAAANGLFARRSSVLTEADGTCREAKLPIIMYHQITSDSKRVKEYVVSCEQFESDLKHIKESGYTTLTARELYECISTGGKLPTKPLIITFDDGCESFYELALPLLEKYDLKAVMSVVGSFTDRFTETEDHNIRYSCLDWNEVRLLSESDRVEIANHTYNMHSNSGGRKGASKMTGESEQSYKQALTADVCKMQQLTLSHTGYEPTAFTFPYGAMSKSSRKIISDLGFRVIFTCEERVNVITDDTSCLLGLGRYNRSGKYSTESFFKKFE